MNKIIKSLFSLAFFALLSTASNAQLAKEHNGPESGSYTPTAPGPTVDLTLSQTTLTGNGTPNQDFEAAYNAYDTEAADDFIIPPGGSRAIVSVEAVLVNPNGIAILRVYNDAGNSPGTLVFSESFPGTAVSPIMLTSATCPPLAPGKYWLSLQMDQPFAGAGQSFWSTATEELGGTPWRTRNLGGGFACAAATAGWADGASCGFAGGTGPGLNYVINLSPILTAPPTVPTLGEWGIMILGIIFLTFGIVAVRQRQLKAAIA